MTYDVLPSFRSDMRFQTICFAGTGLGAHSVSTNGGRTGKWFMSRSSGQSRRRHFARFTPGRSIAFAATVHGCSVHSAFSPGQDIASAVSVGWERRMLVTIERSLPCQSETKRC
jgi:hypothetical protein